MNNVMQPHTTVGSVEHALRLSRAGLSVLPIACDGTKQPLPGHPWKHLQSQIPSEPEIRRMFAGKKGIAIINGKVSGNLETLDIDAPELVEPFESAVRELAPGLLERLPTVASPRDTGRATLSLSARRRCCREHEIGTKRTSPSAHGTIGTLDIDERTGVQRLAPDTLIRNSRGRWIAQFAGFATGMPRVWGCCTASISRGLH